MLLFENSIIQDRIKNVFTQSIAHQRLAHAYIFYGQEGRGKEAFAFELAKVLNCSSAEKKPCNECPACTKINHLNHPDVKYVFPVSRQTTSGQLRDLIKLKAVNPYIDLPVSGHKNIPIETIRELKNEAKYAAFEATKRLFIIHGAEYFSREAANSFLKLLEEPPDSLLIILITDDYHALLDTIRSRCQPVYFPEFTAEQIEQILGRYAETEQNLRPLIRIARYNLKKIFQMLDSAYEEQRELIYQFLKATAAENWFSVSQIIDRMTQKRDKNYIMDLLTLIILWFRDAFHYQISKETEDFINIDYSDSIAKFSAYYADADMDALISLVEKAHFQLQRNAHPALTLTYLSVEMKKHLISSKPMKEAV